MKKFICGVYKITSPTNKVYIGQSYNILSRWKYYQKPKDKLKLNQPKLLNSLKKYGWENHKFEILLECSKELLDTYEILFINEYNSYNIDHGMNCTLGGESNKGRIVSEESRKKISESSKKGWQKRRDNETANLSNKHKENISASLTGKKHSSETIKKMSRPRSEEGKKNMQITHSEEANKNVSVAITDWWNDRKSSESYNSEEEKRKRSERQKQGWITRKANKDSK